ncbi:transposase [Streptomyces sp. FIT100]|uniref:transposase n=1 Tax=Streptomyces sp. FIT100 TaxID=2837956 RepID=UPI0021C88EBC|nr:transposase [Streptomyces sp. FIT100]UUN30794.1 transposase [Streptomyces sp. FIT100]
MQWLLQGARWDADAPVRDDIRAYVLDRLGADNGVLIAGETGLLEKGTASAVVQQHHMDATGRSENNQVGVFLATPPARRALIDRRLCLPGRAWCQDVDRRSRAGVPHQAEFATKPALAGQKIEATLDARISDSWETADEANGQGPTLRALLEPRRIGYVLARRGEYRCRPCSGPDTSDPTVSHLIDASPLLARWS